MKKLLLLLMLCCATTLAARNPETTLKQNGEKLILENRHLCLEINLDNARYSVRDKDAGFLVLKDAAISPGYWNTGSGHTDYSGQVKISWKQKETSREGAPGIRLELDILNTRRMLLPAYLFAFTLYDGASWIEFQAGMHNVSGRPCRLMSLYPFYRAALLPLQHLSDVKTLNGGAGNEATTVNGHESRTCHNNLLFTCRVNGKRYSIVWGGLKYDHYLATASLDIEKRNISLQMSDPVGRRVSVDESWWAPDTYYLGMGSEDPFDALERYGMRLRQANDAHPRIWDFPTLCGWAVGALSHEGNINNSAALVQEMDQANACGLTRYTKVAIRLEPDFYCYKDGNTEQGWWDDEHWSRFGHLVKPYDTFAKWCSAIRERGGIPITYFQGNMPSYDFAIAHPEWMLNNDISQLHLYYAHPRPYVRYDFTDPGFRQYVLDMWKRLRADGMGGIKFDYPESAWITGGGFEDSLASTTSTYRSLFALAREGLGNEAYLLERNLGESKAPMLDVTAGIIDLQRTTWDTNQYKAEYMSKCGLRWYKSRSVFNYYQDSKEVSRISPEVRQSLLTMITMTSGMLELATSFKKLTPEIVHDISRIYPMYSGIRSPRPVDAFTGVKDPMVYDLELTPDYHVLTLFNSLEKPHTLSVSLCNERMEGGLALDPEAEYYAYDFWADRLAGIFSGKDRIERTLNGMACAVYALRKVATHPQVITTNRHLLQGWMDLKGETWDKSSKTLSATAEVVAGETYKVTVALNGMQAVRVETDPDAAIGLSASPAGSGYAVIEISSKETRPVSWTLTCKKQKP